MRLASALALAATLATPALAQTQYADSSGGYVSLSALSFGRYGFGGIDGTAGVRLSNGTDVGIRYSSESDGPFDAFRIGPVVGVTRPLGAGFVGRAQAAIQYATGGGTVQPFVRYDGTTDEGYTYRVRDLREDLSVTVARRIPLVGSVAFQPAVGGFAVARQRITFDFSPAAQFQPARTDGSVGVQIELPLTFRLFGHDAAVSTIGRVSLKGAPFLGDDTVAGGGFRFNF